MAVFQTQPVVEITLGTQTFQAKKPSMAILADLYAKKERGEINDMQFALEFLFQALSPCNSDMTRENFNEGLTPDMAEDITKAYENLGLTDKKKELATSTLR